MVYVLPSCRSSVFPMRRRPVRAPSIAQTKGFRTSEQTPFDIEMRFTMNKLLSCRFNMDTNRVEARFADGSTVAIDCIAIEDE